MIKRALIAVVLLGGIFGGIFYWKYLGYQAMGKAMSQPQPPAIIATAEATLDSWRPSLASVGGLSSAQGIQLTPEVSGLIKELFFESGQEIQQGQPLLRLDDEIDRAALQVLVADARLTELQFERAKELLPKKAMSKSDFDQTEAAVEAARARVAQQKAIIARKTVRAPFSGFLGIRQVDAGEYIEPGDHIVSLQSLDPIYVDYALPERFLPSLAVGQEVEISVGAYPGDVFKGHLQAIEPDVEVATRMVALRARLANPDGRLKPGMFARVVNLLEGQTEAVTVPRTAISLNTYGDFLYLVTDDGKGGLVATRQQVTTGEIRGGRIVVSSGLEAGQQVVRTGLVKLRDGQAIAVDNSLPLDDEDLSHP
jgi:membrane fusion protein (multidrug efflux system)